MPEILFSNTADAAFRRHWVSSPLCHTFPPSASEAARLCGKGGLRPSSMRTDRRALLMCMEEAGMRFRKGGTPLVRTSERFDPSPELVIGEGVPTAPKAPHVCAVREVTASEILELRAHGLRRTLPHEWTGLQLQMLATGIRRALMACSCLGRGFYIERVRLDRDAAENEWERIEGCMS